MFTCIFYTNEMKGTARIVKHFNYVYLRPNKTNKEDGNDTYFLIYLVPSSWTSLFNPCGYFFITKMTTKYNTFDFQNMPFPSVWLTWYLKSTHILSEFLRCLLHHKLSNFYISQDMPWCYRNTNEIISRSTIFCTTVKLTDNITR